MSQTQRLVRSETWNAFPFGSQLYLEDKLGYCHWTSQHDRLFAKGDKRPLTDGIDARRLLVKQVAQLTSTIYREAGSDFKAAHPTLSIAENSYCKLHDHASATLLRRYMELEGWLIDETAG